MNKNACPNCGSEIFVMENLKMKFLIIEIIQRFENVSAKIVIRDLCFMNIILIPIQR